MYRPTGMPSSRDCDRDRDRESACLGIPARPRLLQDPLFTSLHFDFALALGTQPVGSMNLGILSTSLCS